MLALNNNKPLNNWSFGLSVHLKFFLKKISITGRTIITVKKYLDQVICNTGIVELKYLAKPSIIGSIIHADKFNIIAFIKKSILEQWIQ